MGQLSVCPLTGAHENVLLRTVLSGGRPPNHPSYREDGNDIRLIVRPDVFFLDIRDSVRAAQLENRTLTYLERRYKFDKQSLKESLDRMNRKFTSCNALPHSVSGKDRRGMLRRGGPDREAHFDMPVEAVEDRHQPVNGEPA
jgi:hypothetical protein